ncbi:MULTISPECIES: hypothetical protein [Kordiimonas]|jgi:hypothetical protein|uniref:hypothetical protein n=1 Tax=Kordiimonas TaxID=288021 RepID=UPI00257E6B10|nr:hypothetical protein [Kordiimonas sp. UBA4487]
MNSALVPPKPSKIHLVPAQNYRFTLHSTIQPYLSAFIDCPRPPSWLLKDLDQIQSLAFAKPICVTQKPKGNPSGKIVVPCFGGFTIARLLDFIPDNICQDLQIALATYPKISDAHMRTLAAADSVPNVIFRQTPTKDIKALFLKREAPTKTTLKIPNAVKDSLEIK